MNPNQIVSVETAILARECGFIFEFEGDYNYDYGFHSFFQRRSDNSIVPISHWYADTNQNIQQYIDLKLAAPSQSHLRKWLKDVHKIYIELIIDGWSNDECVSDEYIGYRAFVWEIGKPKPHYNDDLGMGTYETILEIALLHSLTLIKK